MIIVMYLRFREPLLCIEWAMRCARQGYTVYMGTEMLGSHPCYFVEVEVT